MIYLTQLIYVHPGKEDIFHEFENFVLPLMDKYQGKLLLRLRPSAETLIAGEFDKPYELHIVGFASTTDMDAFKKDADRQRFLHLKDESVSKVVLIEGSIL